MPITLATAAFNLSVAMGCGALIGFERQFRQRKAGLRTNALVALGAAAFVVFSMLVEGDMSPSRVAAQVVSGIGFLGAGIIFRDGANVQGLTTAATLWCAAAVGLLAGHGHWDYALLTSALVVFVNFALRPFVQWMKKRTSGGALRAQHLVAVFPAAQEAQARGLLLRAFAFHDLHLGALEMENLPQEGAIALSLALSSEADEGQMEEALHRIAAEPGVLRVSWEIRA